MILLALMKYLLSILSLNFFIKHQYFKDKNIEEAQDYYDVQVWANQNSNKQDMFMII